MPDSVVLFEFGAIGWFVHRTHFDREYTMSRGFDDLLVHGPLQFAYLCAQVERWASSFGGRVERVGARFRAPAYINRELVSTGQVDDVSEVAGGDMRIACTLCIAEVATGRIVTEGSATVLRPAHLGTPHNGAAST
jgi:acyl dehydratase